MEFRKKSIKRNGCFSRLFGELSQDFDRSEGEVMCKHMAEEADLKDRKKTPKAGFWHSF